MVPATWRRSERSFLDQSRLTVGLLLPTLFPVGSPDQIQTLEAGVLAEQLGIQGLWVPDHIVWHVPILESLSTLAALAATTRKSTIGTCVLILPLRHPVTLAKALSTIDRLSGGRLVLGIGVGGENLVEFDALGLPSAERGARTDDAMRLLRTLFSEGEHDWASPFWDLEGLRLDPPPLQVGGPPFLVGGRSRRALRRAGRLGDGWIGLFTQPQRYAESWEFVREEAEKAGRDSAQLLPSLLLFCSISKSRAEAEHDAEVWLSRNYQLPFARIRPYVLCGSPSEIAEGLAEYSAAGARHLILCPTGRDSLEQISLVGEEIMPLLEMGEPKASDVHLSPEGSRVRGLERGL